MGLDASSWESGVDSSKHSFTLELKYSTHFCFFDNVFNVDVLGYRKQLTFIWS